MSSLATGQGRDLRFAAINATTASGDNTIVTGVADRKIKVVSYVITSLNANTVKWKSGASGDLSGAMPIGANGGISAQNQASSPQFETVAGQNLVLALGAGVGGAQGHVAYIVEP